MTAREIRVQKSARYWALADQRKEGLVVEKQLIEFLDNYGEQRLKGYSNGKLYKN